MNKLLTIISFSFVLAACATNTPVTSAEVANETMLNEASEEVFDASSESTIEAEVAVEADEIYSGDIPEDFQCEHGASVHVKYSNNGEQATVEGNAPKANWNSETRILTQDVAGSGARYINNDDKSVVYEWHTKGDIGVLSSTWVNGKTYSVNCEAVR